MKKIPGAGQKRTGSATQLFVLLSVADPDRQGSVLLTQIRVCDAALPDLDFFLMSRSNLTLFLNIHETIGKIPVLFFSNG